MWRVLSRFSTVNHVCHNPSNTISSTQSRAGGSGLRYIIWGSSVCSKNSCWWEDEFIMRLKKNYVGLLARFCQNSNSARSTILHLVRIVWFLAHILFNKKKKRSEIKLIAFCRLNISVALKNEAKAVSQNYVILLSTLQCTKRIMWCINFDMASV